MRRLTGLAVLLAVLYICTPSYGNYFLIYNVSYTVKGVNSGQPASIPLKGYLVANIDDSDGSIADANLIIFGKDSLNNNQKTYVQLNYQGGNSSLNIRARTYYNGNFAGFDIWSYHYSADLYFEIFGVGKMVSKDIGTGLLTYVATSLKGSVSVWGNMVLNPDDDVLGTGNISMSLWLPETKYANASGWTQDQIVVSGDSSHQGLLQMVTGKGFVAVTMP